MIQTLLDEVHDGLTDDHIGPVLSYLRAGLHEARQQETAATWGETIEAVCLPHPLTERLQANPLFQSSDRQTCAQMPDARILDSIYFGKAIAAQPITPFGQRLFDYTVDLPLCHALRAQRRAAARQIDKTVVRVAQPHVLTLGAGHTRAADLCLAPVEYHRNRCGLIGEEGAPMAQPCHSGDRMRLRDFRRLPVLRSRLHPGEPAQQDLIYSPLLFNQLADRAAQRLALRLWQALRANGRMIITNIMRSCPDVALFECFGGWRVFDRSPGEMAQLIQSIPPQQIATLDLAEDPQRMIVSLILSKVRA